MTSAFNPSTEFPRPDHFLVHISDTHLLADTAGPDARLHGVAASADNLRRFLDDLLLSRVYPEALIFSGDLADTGDAAAYAALRGIVKPYADAMNAQVIWAMGNHDDRANFRTELLDDAAGVGPGSTPTAPVDYVTMIGGLRIVVLDSSVPGEHYGALDDSQLAWLRDVLAKPAPEGTLLVMHHAPLPCIQYDAMTIELRDQVALADVLAGTDVRSIVSGHVHYTSFGTFAGIPVVTASSTSYSQDLQVPHLGTRGRDAYQAMNFIHVFPTTVLHTDVHFVEGRTVGEEIPGSVG